MFKKVNKICCIAVKIISFKYGRCILGGMYVIMYTLYKGVKKMQATARRNVKENLGILWISETLCCHVAWNVHGMHSFVGRNAYFLLTRLRDFPFVFFPSSISRGTRGYYFRGEFGFMKFFLSLPTFQNVLFTC